MTVSNLDEQIATFTREEERARYLRSYQVRNPLADVGPGTQPYLDASNHADVAMVLYNDAQVIGQATNLSDARGTWADKQGTAFKRPRNEATGSDGFVKISASTGGGTIFAGDELKEPQSGMRFKCGATALYGNLSQVPIEAIDSGPETNLLPNTQLEWVAPRPGIGSRCTVVEQSDNTGLSGGHPRESDEDYTQRLEDIRANPPAGGNDAAYQDTARQTPGIAIQQPFTYPCINGTGTTALCFTLRAESVIGSRIPNGVQIAAVEANEIFTQPGDDGLFMCAIQGQDVAVAFGISWARKAPGWVDASPWPAYIPGDPVKVTSASSSTAFRLTTGTATTTPQAGQTIGFYDAALGFFRRKRIKTVSVVVATKSWDITCETANNASDTSYKPIVGQLPSPWSDSLQALVTPTATYFSKLGPGEQVASFSDPGIRQKRQPESPEAWPNVITNRIVDSLFSQSSILDAELLIPNVPFATPPGVPGVLSYLLELSDISAFKQT